MEFPNLNGLKRNELASLLNTLLEIQNESEKQAKKLTLYRHGFAKLLGIVRNGVLPSSNPLLEKIKEDLTVAERDCEYQIACHNRFAPDLRQKIKALENLLARKVGRTTQATL